jgi:hypothetical protein
MTFGLFLRGIRKVGEKGSVINRPRDPCLTSRSLVVLEAMVLEKKKNTGITYSPCTKKVSFLLKVASLWWYYHLPR